MEAASDYNFTVNSQIDYNTNYLNYYLLIIKSLFKDDRFKHCEKVLIETEKKIIDQDIKYVDKEDGFESSSQALLKIFNNDKIISVILDDIQLTKRCFELLEMMNNTEPERESKGIQTWFKYEESIQSITICGRTHIKGDLLHILSVLAEVDLMKDYIDRFEDLSLFGTVSPFRFLVHSKIKMPMWIDNRDLVICGFGILDAEEKTIMMPFKSIIEPKYIDIEVPQESTSYKRICLKHGFFHLKYIKENTFLLSNSYNVDPKVPVIPWFMLNSILKEISFYVLEGIRNQIENTKNKDVYKKRVQEKKHFYDKVKKDLCGFESKDSNNEGR